MAHLRLLIMLYCHTNNVKDNNSRYSNIKVAMCTDSVEKTTRLREFFVLFSFRLYREQE